MKKRRQVLALFISIFLRNRSLSDTRWFYSKKCKIGKGNLYLIENRLSWNEMCCASDNHNYMCHTFAKEFLNSSFNSSGVSHSDGSCVLGRIHSDVSSNIPKKVYHIVTDNFVNLLHISYAWLYKTECWGRKFHAFSFNSHRNCKIFMTSFNFIFDTICVPYIFRKSIFGWNCDHDTPLCDTPLLEDTPLCDTPDELSSYWQNIKFSRYCPKFHIFTKMVIFQVYLQLFRPTASSL